MVSENTTYNWITGHAEFIIASLDPELTPLVIPAKAGIQLKQY